MNFTEKELGTIIIGLWQGVEWMNKWIERANTEKERKVAIEMREEFIALHDKVGAHIDKITTL